MLLQPKKTKYRKRRKGRISVNLTKHKANGGALARHFTLKYGNFGLVSLVGARLTARQLEAARRTISRGLRRTGRLWLRAFPDMPVSEKPKDARMGKGKGAVGFWVSVLHPGQLLYEIGGVEEGLARSALQKASKKLPFPTRVIQRLEPLNCSLM